MTIAHIYFIAVTAFSLMLLYKGYSDDAMGVFLFGWVIGLFFYAASNST